MRIVRHPGRAQSRARNMKEPCRWSRAGYLTTVTWPMYSCLSSFFRNPSTLTDEPSWMTSLFSSDLPFAQSRWCGAAGVDKVKTLSDYKTGKFGESWGTMIRDWRVQSRAVFVVDSDNTVRYAEYVPEIAEHPNYDAVLEAAKSVAGS